MGLCSTAVVHYNWCDPHVSLHSLLGHIAQRLCRCAAPAAGRVYCCWHLCAHSCLHLQTTTGKPASDITMVEFNELLADLKRVLESKRREARLRVGEQFILCLDHATAHNQATQILGQGWQLLPHPAHSPDCNKPIEHVHGQLDAKMKQWLVEIREATPNFNPTPQQCMAQATAYFNAIPTASIAADVATLPDTWQEIVNNAGEYICDRLS